MCIKLQNWSNQELRGMHRKSLVQPMRYPPPARKEMRSHNSNQRIL